jgi:hypothetical protein
MFIVCLSPLTLLGRILIRTGKQVRKIKTKQKPGFQTLNQHGEDPQPYIVPGCAT